MHTLVPKLSNYSIQTNAQHVDSNLRISRHIRHNNWLAQKRNHVHRELQKKYHKEKHA